jgi:membrane protein implicated in regulation of membrane protease activity
MKALRKLILGETWSVPIGVALVLAAGLLLRGDGWWVGFVLLAGVVITLSVSLRRRLP